MAWNASADYKWPALVQVAVTGAYDAAHGVHLSTSTLF